MPRLLKTCYAKLQDSVPWPVIPPAEPATDPAVEPAPTAPESVEPMPDSGDYSSSYYSSESDEEEVEMPATSAERAKWAERQQMEILQVWNTRQAEETRAHADVERDNAELLRIGEETSRRRFRIEERGRRLMEAERQEALRYEARRTQLRDEERRARRDEERRAPRNVDAGEGPSGAS